jgi:hypothetical protein
MSDEDDYQMLKMNTVCVKIDDIVEELALGFDYEFSGESVFNPPPFALPENFNLGVIVGPSGSGKSTLLNGIGTTFATEWYPDRAICSHFDSADDARNRFGAVGLNSVPVWMKPYHVLSTGEKFRADMARQLGDGALIDEYTSVVDRDVAKSCSYAIQRYIRNNSIGGVVLATCHRDVIDWLMPDWVFDTQVGGFASSRGSERRPDITVKLKPTSAKAWEMFRDHHYLTKNINKSSRCWIALWGKTVIGFTSILAFPSGSLKFAWREHRTVVLPEFQGLGLGVRISDAIGSIVTSDGGRYFSKTSHYRMGEYREQSNSWRATSKNKKARPDYAAIRATKESKYKHLHIDRVCYSHEYVGAEPINQAD